ncbi:MAG: FAD-binding oxidoreductase [Anaerolineae bacterium]
MLKENIIQELQTIVGEENVLTAPEELFLYEYDASLNRAQPEAVVLPGTAEEVAQVVKLCYREGIPFTPRGAGTNLSGGSVPIKGGVVIVTNRLNRVLEIDIPNQRAVVEPGIFNLDLQRALAKHGYLYAPDPASQKVSTMGGNVAENSGGPHCLKYGVTTNHVLGLEVVLPNGEIVHLGGKALDIPGYDLVGLMVGSEGTLGIVTKITVRIMRQPEAVKTMLVIFDDLETAGKAVSGIIAAGIIPATLEMMDNVTIKAVEKAVKAGYPLDAEAVLIIELDGLKDDMERVAGEILEICRAVGAREVKMARTPAERDQLWAGRRGAFGAVGSVHPYLVCDGTVPRTKLPEVLRKVAKIGEKYGLEIANVFHAGDGNLHPLILFDARDKEQEELVLRAGAEILAVCAEAGGTISGEHGIGIDKIQAMSLIFSPAEISAMRLAKEVFDPKNLCNPGKVLPE